MRRDELFATDTEAIGETSGETTQHEGGVVDDGDSRLVEDGRRSGQGSAGPRGRCYRVAAGISRPWWSVSSVAQKDRSGVMACCGAAILSRMLGGWALIADPFRLEPSRIQLAASRSHVVEWTTGPSTETFHFNFHYLTETSLSTFGHVPPPHVMASRLQLLTQYGRAQSSGNCC